MGELVVSGARELQDWEAALRGPQSYERGAMNRAVADTVKAELVEDLDFEALLPVRLKKVADVLAASTRQLFVEVEGVNFTETRILAYLANRPDSSVLEISRDLLVDKAWISRLLRGLGEKRLIERRDQGEGRQVLINLSPAGRSTYARIMAQVALHNGAVVKDVDGEAARRIFDQLERNIQAVMSQLEVPPERSR